GTAVCHGHKGSCTVPSSVGRGRVVAPPGGGPGIGGERDIVLQNLDVVGTSIGGNKLTATDVSVTNVPGASVGIFVERKATLSRVESSGGYVGIYGLDADVKGTDIVVQNNGAGGISAGRVRITRLTAVSEVLDFSQTPSTWGVCASD